MDLEYDPAKRALTLEQRGIDFESVRDFDFQTALSWIDERKDYGEVRWVAIGFIGDRLHVVCFKETDAGIRVISLRKANSKEAKRYHEYPKQLDD